jgi:cell division septation protein DedD
VASAPPEAPERRQAPTETLPRECPRCGTPYDRDQEYCLECGLRLPQPSGVVSTLSDAWRRRLGWYPGDWIWPALLGLVVAALGATAAIYFTNNDESARGTIQATNPSVPAQTSTLPAPPEPTTNATVTRPPAPPPAPTLVTWPAAKSGWTVVLFSYPASTGRQTAFSQARRALQTGLSQVGVLNSSEFSTLHPGYYVVFAGIFDNEDDAQAGLSKAKANDYGAAYVRPIRR